MLTTRWTLKQREPGKVWFTMLEYLPLMLSNSIMGGQDYMTRTRLNLKQVSLRSSFMKTISMNFLLKESDANDFE